MTARSLGMAIGVRVPARAGARRRPAASLTPSRNARWSTSFALLSWRSALSWSHWRPCGWFCGYGRGGDRLSPASGASWSFSAQVSSKDGPERRHTDCTFTSLTCRRTRAPLKRVLRPRRWTHWRDDVSPALHGPLGRRRGQGDSNNFKSCRHNLDRRKGSCCCGCTCRMLRWLCLCDVCCGE